MPLHQFDLLKQLVIRNLKVRYTQPMLGFFWAFLSPGLTVGTFFVVFSVFLKVQITEVPFVLYLMSAVFPWGFFQDTLIASSSSLVDNKNIIREAKFPHYLIPLAIAVSNAVTFLPTLLLIVFVSLVMLKGVPALIVFLPLVLALHFTLTVSLAIIFSLLYVRWRDTKFMLEAVLLLLFYMTPVFYSLRVAKDVLPPLLGRLYAWNPFVGILTLYRLALLKGFAAASLGSTDTASLVLAPAVFAALACLASVYLYRKNKKTINDYLAY